MPPMTDIVERLHASAQQAGHSKEWDPYAWIESMEIIEQLRAYADQLYRERLEIDLQLTRQDTENERLRTALQKIADGSWNLGWNGAPRDHRQYARTVLTDEQKP